MKFIVIHFARLGPYHVARLKSAGEVLGPMGWRVVALETAGGDSTYAWERMESVSQDFERRTVFKDRVFEEISASEVKRGIFQELDKIQPQAVAIAGWGTADARACLAWCQKNSAKAIVMSETRAADGRRVWWKEWIKSRLVRKFDGALCGGESHKRYLMDLGMPEERIAFGYNVVDNQFFGTIRDGEYREQGREAGLTTEDTTERLGGREMEQPKVGPKGEGVGTTETKSTELEARARLSCQAGDVFSTPFTSELARNSENSSRTHFASDSSSRDTSNTLPTIGPHALVDPYFLSSNRFVKRKNLKGLIRAYARYMESFQGGKKVWPLVLLGDGELRGDLETLCVDLGLQFANSEQAQNLKLNSYKLKTPAIGGLVVFAGFRQIEELPAFYAGAGAFVHPALEEPWGLVINEAMASGLPVLSSRNVGAAEELVVNGKTGYLFDPRNIEEMANAMSKVSGMTQEERLTMGRAAFEMVERKAPAKAFGKGLAKLLMGEL